MQSTERQINFLRNPWLWVFLIGALLAAVLSVQAHLTTHYDDGRNLTNYNNYVIFRQSYVHLTGHQDLYLKYKYEYWDLFKYTPTFAVLMAPFAWLPVIPGLLLWNLINVFALIAGVKWLNVPAQKKKILLLAFCLIELVTSVQNEQSNGLVAGLLIGALALAERRMFFAAIGLIVVCGYIKIIGLAALAMLLFYPGFWRNAFYTVIWMIALWLLPLLVITPQELIFQYSRWLEILAEDTAGFSGLSVITMVRALTGTEVSSTLIQLAGLFFILLPLCWYRRFKTQEQRIQFLSLVLIWMVIYNHKAESPTFIIAVSGAGLWYFTSPRNKLHDSLMIFCILFTQLSATDLFPEKWQTGIFHDWAVKAIPCLLIWITALASLLRDLVRSGNEPDPHMTV